MNIAVLGSNGYIGSVLADRLEKLNNHVVKISKSLNNDVYQINLESPEIFNYEILRSIDYLIITAAISSPDICSKQYESSYKINVIGTKYFINKALEYNCKIIFFSSDAVFGTDLHNAFDENSKTFANTAYGVMKKEIEDSYKSHALFKAIRLSYVISSKDKFTSYLLKCRQNSEIAEIYHPFYRNCISLDDVIDSVCWLVLNWGDFDSTFLNVCGSDLASRVRIIDEINRISKSKINYNIVKPSEDFFNNRAEVTEMRSLYLNRILKNWDEPLSMKIKKQLRDVIISG
jgi:dTDP-4-dehydrorhamnose reductase